MIQVLIDLFILAWNINYQDMKKIVIVGSGGFAKEVAFLINEINGISPQWTILGFIGSDIGKMNGRYQVINDDLWLENIDEELYVAFGIGNPTLIHTIFTKICTNKNLKFPNLGIKQI